ncbi:MAG: hypothetical protein KC560_13710, partial [Myxococcales bacterium]|nr:hypothetical protein [Myxococcales bacterium]
MPLRLCGFVLFVAGFLSVPFPMLGFDAFVPAVRYAQLAAVLAVLRVEEGGGGVIDTLLVLLGGHAIAASLAVALGAWLATRLVLARLPSRLRDHVTVIAATLLVALAS